MRRGFMGMMLKTKCNRRSGWGKGLLHQKKHEWVGQRSRWCCLCFLIGKALSICTTWSDGKQMYQEVLARLRGIVRRKSPESWENQTWMLHHDNAPDSSSLLIRSYLAKHRKSVVPYPPYSPDLGSEHFFLFPKFKTPWKYVVSKQ